MIVQPEYRQAVLTRFATDLAVLVADVESQRPASMQCCNVIYDAQYGTGKITCFQSLCDPTIGQRFRSWTTGQHCAHIHHKFEVVLA